jgi:hypothetical protein
METSESGTWRMIGTGLSKICMSYPLDLLLAQLFLAFIHRERGFCVHGCEPKTREGFMLTFATQSNAANSWICLNNSGRTNWNGW